MWDAPVVKSGSSKMSYWSGLKHSTPRKTIPSCPSQRLLSVLSPEGLKPRVRNESQGQQHPGMASAPRRSLGTNGRSGLSREPGTNQARSQGAGEEEAGQLWPPQQEAPRAGGCSADRLEQGDTGLTGAGGETGQDHTLGLIPSKSWGRKQLQISPGLLGPTS